MAEKELPKELRKYVERGLSETETGERIRLWDGKGHRVSSAESQFATVEQRTLTAQLEYVRLLSEQIRHCQFTAIYSFDAFARSVIMLLRMVPLADQDEQFKKDVQRAKIKTISPTGRWVGFGGQKREIVEVEVSYNFYDLFAAVRDWARRRGLLWAEQTSQFIP